MTVKTLYRYIRPDGGVTVSLDKPDGAYTERCRLIADEGMILSHPDHENTSCIDVDSADGWTEIPDSEYNETEDMRAALNELGVEKE